MYIGVGDGFSFPLLRTYVRLSFLCDLLGALTASWDSLDAGQRGACNVPPLRGVRTGNGLCMYLDMIYELRISLHASQHVTEVWRALWSTYLICTHSD